MDMRKQAEKAEKFRKLHHRPRMLLLPNAWDVASAGSWKNAASCHCHQQRRVAYSLGYADGQRISRGKCWKSQPHRGAANIPVTADLEAGYGTTPRTWRTPSNRDCRRHHRMNLEDVTGDDESSLVDLPLQVEKIRAIREAASSAGVPFVLNARTDIYLMPSVRKPRALSEPSSGCALSRSGRGLPLRAGSIRPGNDPELVQAVKAPLNIWRIPPAQASAQWKKPAWPV